MDPISHLVLTAACQQRERRWWIGALGPDLTWYALYPLWLLASGKLAILRQANEWPMPPDWVRVPHYAAHSLVLLGLICVVWPNDHVRCVARSWLLHILIDIPTHSRDRMAPRPLWPLWNGSLDGFSWADWVTSRLVSLYQGIHPHRGPDVDASPNQAIL